jgi:DNA modification methylase
VLATLDPLSALATQSDEQLTALLDGLQPTSAALGSLLRELAPPVPKQLNPDDADLTPPEDPVTQSGDLWLLGDHRLLCGDATNADDVALLLDSETPNLMVTDPPYGVNYDPAWRNKAAAEGLLAYAARRIGPVPNDERSDWREAWALFPGDIVYSWHPPGATSLVHAAALQDSGFTLRMQIIWAKSNFPIGRGDYHVRHEPCWYAIRTGKPARRTDDRTQTTLWEINLDRNVEGGHSTQKPVECMARPMRNHEPCDVYDPFCGSGTTVIAAEQLGRRCFALEINPAYCDVIVRRWEHVTGRKADRVGASSEVHA